MLRVGYRIRLSSHKGPDREGVITAVTGSMLRVRWQTEDETTVIPAPGTLTVLASATVPPQQAVAKRGAPKRTAGKKVAPEQIAAKKTAAKKKAAAKKTAAKKAAAKKTAPKKTAARKTAKEAPTPTKGATRQR